MGFASVVDSPCRANCVGETESPLPTGAGTGEGVGTLWQVVFFFVAVPAVEGMCIKISRFPLSDLVAYAIPFRHSIEVSYPQPLAPLTIFICPPHPPSPSGRRSPQSSGPVRVPCAVPT